MVSSNCKWATSWRQHAEEINEKKNPPKQAWTTEIFIIDDNNIMLREQPARSAGCLCLTTCWVLFIRLLSNSAIWDQARRGTLTFTAISRKVVGKMCSWQSRKEISDMINTLFLDTAADIHKQTCMASRAILSERKTNNLKTWTGMVGGCIFKIVIVEGAEGGSIWNCFFLGG